MKRIAEQEVTVDEVGELDVSEYIVLLLSWDTYFRYLKEVSNSSEISDELMQRGLMLLKQAETQSGDGFLAFLDESLPTPSHKKMLAKAWRFALTRDGLPRKALQLRTLLSRGGASTMRKVFKTNKALQQVRAALSASMVEDADAALDLFAVISLRNARIRSWIDKAAENAGSGTFQNPVTAGGKESVDDGPNILATRIQQAAASPTSQQSTDANVAHEEILAKVQTEAQEAAQKALSVIGEQDVAPTKSEVIGIATAAAVSALTDPTRIQNIPPALRSHANDAEQLDAAMAMGRVIVAAGAGSGKTATLTSRLAYLVDDLKVSPNRIFACSFNTKASMEIRERVAAKVGSDVTAQMSIGTMHSMFKRFVTSYGNAEEKAALSTWLMPSSEKDRNNGRGAVSRAPTPGALFGFMTRVWKECYGTDPPTKASNTIQAWQMNNISPAQAKTDAISEEEKVKAEWYAWFLGFKGVTKNWEPPCVRKNQKAAKEWGAFLAKWRDNGKARLGDFSDMILMYRDVLRRSPDVRKKVQALYDHVAVDEAQDLNEVQHEIIQMMTEHISADGSDKRSWFMVGDEIQSINRFVGARPELFAQYTKREDFQVKKITTNYRCLPEIIETANRLMSNHPKQIPMEARPDANKPRGAASIVLQTPTDHAEGAISVIGNLKQDLEAGANISDYAVLTRTNMEMNDYETACIIEGIPYGRKGGTSFLKSPETITVMCYFNLVVGQDFERMQKSLIEVLDKPRRFFLRSGEAETAVNSALRTLARVRGVSEKAVNPLDILAESKYLIDAMDSRRDWPSWRVKAASEEIDNLYQHVSGMRSSVESGKLDRNTGKTLPYTTQDVIGDILAVTGKPEKYGEAAPTLRDVLMPASSGNEEEADSPDDEDDNKKPIGNVAFLFKIAQPTPDSAQDPTNPVQFKARIDYLAAASKDLRVDLNQWYRQQQQLSPEHRKPPPCVTLSTVHSVKGAQWNNTTVVMAKGVFPYEPKKKEGDPEVQLTPEQQERLAKEQEAEFLTERQLAYVAMTRAAKELTIVSPMVSAYGRDAGPSIFVHEAGLSVGQNVAGKEATSPEPVVKMAFVSALWGNREAEELDELSSPSSYMRS